MPFVTKEHRTNPDLSVAGDRCYLYYRDMLRLWEANPRWTTAHNIYDAVSLQPDTARELAWQVFFQLHVMPYEIKKREENGEC